MNNSYSKSDRMIFLGLLSSLAGVAMMAFPMSGYVNASNVNASNVNASNTSGTSNPYATFMETPNMIAAGGPIPPNYTLVQQEANCIAEQKNPPWYPTMLGYERGDSNRTGLYACATFTGSFTEPNQVYAYKSPDKYYTPAVMVTRGTNEMYVYGGSNAASTPVPTASYVARIEPGTLKELWLYRPCQYKHLQPVDRSWWARITWR